MKRFRTLLLALIGALALSFGVFALAACSKSDPSGTNPPVEISAEYKAIYDNYYKTAAGEGAKTLEDWYADLTADIDEIDTDGEIASLDVVTVDGTQYVSITYANGTLWLEKLVGGQRFGECVKFVLNAKDKTDKSVSGLNLQIGKLGATERTNKVRTSVHGEAVVYVEAGTTDTYKVYVESTSSADYGFAVGYEPTFTVSQSEKTVNFTVMGTAEKATATAKVEYKAQNNAATKDIHVDLVYAKGDEAEGITVAEGVSGADGKITYSYYPHAGSVYALKVNDSLLPATYEPTNGAEIPLAGLGDTLITLIRKKNYAPEQSYKATGEVTEAPDVTDRDIEPITIPASGAFDTLVTGSENNYTYNGKQVYVALDYLMERVHATKTISDLLEEEDFFSHDEQTDEKQNTWTHYSYKQRLQAYVEKADNNGLYPLNADLIEFVKAAAEWKLFADGTGEELDAFLPLVTYSDEKLALGEELTDFSVTIRHYANGFSSSYFNTYKTTVKLMNDIPEGWYILTASADKTAFGEAATNYLGGCIDETDPGFSIQNASYRHALRFFTTTKEVKENTVEFTAYIYLGPNTREIHFGSSGASDTSVQMKLEAVADGVLKGAKKPLIGVEKFTNEGTYEFPVFPESMFVNNSTNSTYRYVTNIMLGNLLDTSRTYVTYTLAPQLGGTTINGLKATYYVLTSSSFGTGINVSAAHVFDDGDNATYTLGEYASNYAFPGVIFTHNDGDEIKTVTIKITAAYSRYTVRYEAGEGAVGEIYSTDTVNQYTTGNKHTVLDLLDEGIGFTKDGYTFIGWHNKANEGNAVDYLPGEQLTIESSDVVLVAVWRENHVGTSDPLKAGSSVTAEIDETLYTSTEIPFASSFEYNKAYKLTINAGAQEWGGWTVMLGERTVGLIYDESAGVYVAYIFPGEGDDRICILTPDGSDKMTVTVALAEYVPVELSDGAEAIIPIAPEGIEGFILNFASDLVIPGSYRITFESVMPVEGAKITAVVNVMPDEVENWNGTGEKLHIDLVEGAKNLTLTYDDDSFGVAKISFDRAYTIKYDMGAAAISSDDDDALVGTGETAPQTYIIAGEEVALSESGFEWADHTFIGWTLEGDTEEKVYYAGGKFEMPASDVLFHAQWLVNQKMDKTIDLTFVDSPAENMDIDPTVYTEFTVKITNATVSTTTQSKGYMIYFDLKNNKYDGVINLTVSDTAKVLIRLAHSDVLSVEGHNIFAGNYQWTQNTKSTFIFTLSLDDWREAGNPILKGVDVYCIATNKTRAGTAQYNAKLNRYEWNTFARPEGIFTRNSGGNDMGNFFPSDLLNGYTFTVHVKSNYPTPLKLYYGTSSSGSRISYNNLLTSENGKEFTFEMTTSSSVICFGFHGGFASDPFYGTGSRNDEGKGICFNFDVWAEIKDLPAKTLKEDTPYDGVTVKNGEPVEITLDPSVKAAESSSATSTQYWDIIVTGATAPVKIAYYETSSSSSTKTVEVNGDNLYTASRLSFGNRRVTVSTESETEQNITIKLVKCVIHDFSVGVNAYTLPAGNARLNIYNRSSSSDLFVKILKENGEELDSGTVIKILNGSDTIELNKENEFYYEGRLQSYVQIWSESGEQKINVYAANLNNFYFASSADTSKTVNCVLTPKLGMYVEFNSNSTSIKLDEYIKHKITLEIPEATKEYHFTLTYNKDKTAEFVAESNTKYTVTITLRADEDGNKEDLRLLISSTDLDKSLDCKFTLEYTYDFVIEQEDNYFDVKASHMGDSEEKYFYVNITNSGFFTSGTSVTVLAKTEQPDLSNLRLKIVDAKGGPVEISGFTKGANEEWKAIALVTTTNKMFRVAIYGVDFDVQLAFEFIKCTTTVGLDGFYNEEFVRETANISGYTYRARLMLDSSIKKDTEYVFSVVSVAPYGTSSTNNTSKHSSDALEFNITGMTLAGGGAVKITQKGDINVKFTGDYFDVVLSGCNSEATDAAAHHNFAFRIIEAGEKTLSLGENKSFDIATAKTATLYEYGSAYGTYSSYTTFMLDDTIKGKEGYYNITVKVNNAEDFGGTSPIMIVNAGQKGCLAADGITGFARLCADNAYTAIIKIAAADTVLEMRQQSNLVPGVRPNVDITLSAYNEEGSLSSDGKEHTITLGEGAENYIYTRVVGGFKTTDSMYSGQRYTVTMEVLTPVEEDFSISFVRSKFNFTKDSTTATVTDFYVLVSGRLDDLKTYSLFNGEVYYMSKTTTSQVQVKITIKAN